MSEKPWSAGMEEMLARLPESAGMRYAVAFKHGTMEAGFYAPVGHDPQQPHLRDELYIVMRGGATFVRGGESLPVGPGDLLFVPARMEHRFEDMAEEFAVWVVFYGPEGGEADPAD